MKNKHLLISIFFGLTLLFFANCDDGEKQVTNNLIGIWDYTQITISSCNNSNDNDVIDYSGNGFCTPTPDINICTKLSLEMDAENYSIKSAVNTGGSIEITTIEEGTYSISATQASSTVVFCTDLLCRTTTYVVSGDALRLESIDSDNGCNTIIIAEKR